MAAMRSRRVLPSKPPLFSGDAQAQVFDGPGGSGSGSVQMFRRSFGLFGADTPFADPDASHGFAEALRMAIGVYSNALLIVASIILLYHLLVMVAETAHQRVVGGKRTWRWRRAAATASSAPTRCPSS